MDKTDRLRDYGLAFLLYEQSLGICGYELIRELFIFIKLILNSYLTLIIYKSYHTMDREIYKYKCSDCGHEFIGVDMELNCTAESAPVNAQSVAV